MSLRNVLVLIGIPLWINAAATGCDNTTGVPDLAPPAAVVDLHVDDVTTTSVVLRWTAPGNDGSNGTAARYDVRHSAAPITDSSFDAATAVAAADVPNPAAAGTPQELTVAGLTPHAVHYFALRATDRAGNRAAISNLIHTATENWGHAQSEDELIGQLKMACQARDYDGFRRLLHPGLAFFLNEPAYDGTAQWGQAEESRIHFRMFRPEAVQPPEPAVPAELWLVSVDITLTARDGFRDATTYYYDPTTNPTGFHREDFAVSQTDYAASVFFQTHGETQYRVDGSQYFVVVNDLAKLPGDEGKFLLYRWEDLGAQASVAKSPSTWSYVKSLYRR